MPMPRPAIPSALKTLAALAILIYAARPNPAATTSHWTDYDTE